MGEVPAGYLSGRDLHILEEEISRLEDLLHSFLQFAGRPRWNGVRSISMNWWSRRSI